MGSERYSTFPTVDIHLSQINFTDAWYEMLIDYIKPMVDRLYIGYNTQVGTWNHLIPADIYMLFSLSEIYCHSYVFAFQGSVFWVFFPEIPVKK